MGSYNGGYERNNTGFQTIEGSTQLVLNGLLGQAELFSNFFGGEP